MWLVAQAGLDGGRRPGRARRGPGDHEDVSAVVSVVIFVVPGVFRVAPEWSPVGSFGLPVGFSWSPVGFRWHRNRADQEAIGFVLSVSLFTRPTQRPDVAPGGLATDRRGGLRGMATSMRRDGGRRS